MFPRSCDCSLSTARISTWSARFFTFSRHARCTRTACSSSIAIITRISRSRRCRYASSRTAMCFRNAHCSASAARSSGESRPNMFLSTTLNVLFCVDGMLTRAELDDDGFSSHTVDIAGEGRANPERRGAKQASRGRRLQK